METGFHYVEQASLKLLTSSDPPALPSQSAGITRVRYCSWPWNYVKWQNLRIIVSEKEEKSLSLKNLFEGMIEENVSDIVGI